MRWLQENRLAAIALATLVVLNVILIALLFRPRTPPSADPYIPPTQPEPTTTAPEPVPSTTTTAPEDEPTTAAPVEPVPALRLLTIASVEIGWRATVGDCETPGLVEFSGDGGQTWATTDPGLAPVVRLKALAETTAFAIGGAEDCEPSFTITASAGAEWESQDNELPGAWYLEPADRNAVHGPGGTAAPCTTQVVDVAGLTNTQAAVLCTDGAVHLTGDAGATWAAAGNLAGGVALAPQLSSNADNLGYLFASLEEGCDGVAVRFVTEDVAGLTDTAACVPVPDAQPGAVALALNEDVAWLWAGEQVLVSADAGTTW
ncbi:hypothetical protein [Occultella gossypii]|uniref:Photosynthesis system II assembly factor Ycf48/Hcf136-like domain-containing protein n=1 Tax=Occultella gossypii TaxID=2800820 RepID=A0ABS7SGU1_9MICO|nr:hypothetical protein [Occultella gossypii]MBZ2199138.1 hypothetical protein [Occultella gossypii]